jgi:hypothetical protein
MLRTFLDIHEGEEETFKLKSELPLLFRNEIENLVKRHLHDSNSHSNTVKVELLSVIKESRRSHDEFSKPKITQLLLANPMDQFRDEMTAALTKLQETVSQII